MNQKKTGIERTGNTSHQKAKIKIFLYLVIALSLMVLYYVIVRFSVPNIEHRGLFGDTFGAISALFSGGALIGVIISLYYQREDLRLQREELKLNRQELTRTADAQEGSREAMQEQVRTLSRTALITAYAYLSDYNDKMVKDSSVSSGADRIKYDQEGTKYRKGLRAVLTETEFEWRRRT